MASTIMRVSIWLATSCFARDLMRVQLQHAAARTTGSDVASPLTRRQPEVPQPWSPPVSEYRYPRLCPPDSVWLARRCDIGVNKINGRSSWSDQCETSQLSSSAPSQTPSTTDVSKHIQSRQGVCPWQTFCLDITVQLYGGPAARIACVSQAVLLRELRAQAPVKLAPPIAAGDPRRPRPIVLPSFVIDPGTFVSPRMATTRGPPAKSTPYYDFMQIAQLRTTPANDAWRPVSITPPPSVASSSFDWPPALSAVGQQPPRLFYDFLVPDAVGRASVTAILRDEDATELRLGEGGVSSNAARRPANKGKALAPPDVDQIRVRKRSRKGKEPLGGDDDDEALELQLGPAVEMCRSAASADSSETPTVCEPSQAVELDAGDVLQLDLELSLARSQRHATIDLFVIDTDKLDAHMHRPPR